jgi:type VI secretion system protein ImpL
VKRILIGILIFLVFLALVIWGGFALKFEGTKLILFCVILGLFGALAIGFVVWILGKSGGNSATSGGDTPDAINLNSVLRDADAKVRQANRAGAKSLAGLPLIYVIGDENSAKTQTVLQSGLDPELLAGNVFQDGQIVPTQLANLWLAGNYVLVEAGGALLLQPPLWLRLVRATIPARLGSIFGDSRLPARSVVVCVSIERILAPSTSEQIRALAQMLNERLRQLSQTLGISLPIYVLFTKLDRVTPFADYANRLSEEEIKLPIGSLLSSLSTGTGLYTEQASALIGARFDQLLYALAEFRLDILSRGGELQDLARAYEFPRDLRKLRNGIVAFLAEVARPSQIGVNPFLRGFFFAGMRAHIVEDVLEVGPAQPQAAAPVDAGATRIFSLAAQFQQPTAPQPRRGGTRKVPQWVFLPHLFSKILLADKSALETSRASTRTSFLKRALLATASALILVVLALVTVSFFKNHALEERVAKATTIAVSPVAAGGFAAQGDLETLDKLRAVLAELDDYRKNGPPLMDTFGLYKGDALYPVACRAYAGKFRTLLLAPTQNNILAKFSALPASPAADADYGATYHPLKAYLITATDPDPDTAQDTVEFLPAQLLKDWSGSATPDPAVSQLAQAQFTFYANLLPGSSSCMASAGGSRNDMMVVRARTYLNGFQGSEHVYQSMLAAANRKVKGFNYNDTFPGSSKYIFDAYPVQGAFTKDGFVFMQAAILNPNQYLGGEEWVLGRNSAPPPDPATLAAALKKEYSDDFIKAWRAYLTTARYNPNPLGYRDFYDGADKLSALDVDISPLLELFSLISYNTAVDSPEITTAFRAPQNVVPPSSQGKSLTGDTNRKYMGDLRNLEGQMRGIAVDATKSADPTAGQPVIFAAVAAEQDVNDLRSSFGRDPDGGMADKSFELLIAPIKAAENLANLAPLKAAGTGAQQFCAQVSPLLTKFPFNPDANDEASTDEVARVFAPGTGTFSAFVATQAIHGIVIQQGSQFVQANPKPPLNPEFLKFLSNAQKISSTLFAGGGNQPSLDFNLEEVKSPGVPDATVSIDDKQILTTAGQKASYHWVSTPGGHYGLSNPGNSRTSQPSPWSAFHLALNAVHVPPDRLKIDLQTNNQSNGVILLDVSGSGALLLNRDFMKGFRCVSNVAR